MKCDHARELLSAAADGELTTDERTTLDRHVEGCTGCRSHADRIARLDRQLRIRPAEAVPDLVDVVTARARPARLGRGGWIRPALAWVALVIFVQNVPALVLGNAGDAETHVARHIGAFGVALAFGFAFAAWKPHRAFGLLPFTAALVATIVLSATFDLLDGGRTAVAEAAHIGELVGLTLLWMLAGSPGWHGFRRRAPRRSPSPTAG
ncbi:MAG: zf-HC2 domain-containing protein [Ilumatobacteraceae bacterium]